jgi:hypothetical protein
VEEGGSRPAPDLDTHTQCTRVQGGDLGSDRKTFWDAYGVVCCVSLLATPVRTCQSCLCVAVSGVSGS